MRVVFDIDFLIFECVSVAQVAFITATHIPTGNVTEFENKTELWGNWRTKVGGWIGLQNEISGEEYYKAADFTVVEGIRPRPFRVKVIDADGEETTTFLSPFDGAKKIMDDQIKAICTKLGATSYFGYTGTGDVFRHKLATLLPYKGNRGDTLRPLLLDQMKEYVVEHHNCVLVRGIEADDAVAMAAYAGYKAWKENDEDDDFKVIAATQDKDSKGTTGWHYNPKKDTAPRLIEGLGSLWLTDKGDVDGQGRMWFYWQCLHGDEIDGYKANCHSDKKYGGKGAYSDLKDCTSDKQALEVMVAKFKWMYPEKKVVTTFRGDIEIDAMYVFQQMVDMAHMQRFENDRLIIKDVLDKIGVVYA